MTGNYIYVILHDVFHSLIHFTRFTIQIYCIVIEFILIALKLNYLTEFVDGAVVLIPLATLFKYFLNLELEKLLFFGMKTDIFGLYRVHKDIGFCCLHQVALLEDSTSLGCETHFIKVHIYYCKLCFYYTLIVLIMESRYDIQ